MTTDQWNYRWSAALPSILGSRLLLNMREKVERSGDDHSYIIETIGPRHAVTFTMVDPHGEFGTPPASADIAGYYATKSIKS